MVIKVMYCVFQKQKEGGKTTVAESPAASTKPLIQPPTTSTNASSAEWRASQPSRTQSVPAPDTSGWTRVDDGKLSLCFIRIQLRWWFVLRLYHNCDSTTIQLWYDDTTTHSTATKVIEITYVFDSTAIRLRYNYSEILTFSLPSNWKQACTIRRSRIVVGS